MYRPLRGITLTRPSCSFRMPNCAAKTCPPSMYVPGPGFSPGPPTASPGMTIGRSDPLLSIGVSLSRNASKWMRLLEPLGARLGNPSTPRQQVRGSTVEFCELDGCDPARDASNHIKRDPYLHP